MNKYSLIAFNLVPFSRPILLKNIPDEFLNQFLPSVKIDLLKEYFGEYISSELIKITKTKVEDEISNSINKNIKLITIDDEDYPKNLKLIPDPPPVLYFKGKKINEKIKIGIVGPRDPSSYGFEVARFFVKGISKYDLETVSGLAMGIDTVVHKVSIENSIDTLAILGTAIDVIYPKFNEKLFEDISNGAGTLISEFPLGTLGRKENFPRRNRIIAGISDAVLIVEAAKQSGALITASFARDFGKEVFSIPGDIFSAHSVGTNILIQTGAKMVLSPDDMLEERIFANITTRNCAPRNKINKYKEIENEAASELLKFLTKPKSLDEVINFYHKKNCKFDYSILTNLELKGKIKVNSDNIIYNIKE